MKTNQRRSLAAAVAVLAACTALLETGCSQYQPVATGDLIEQRLAEQLDPELAARVEVPFQINDEIRSMAAARLNPAGSERRRTNAILDFVFASLDLQYSLVPTRDAVGTFEARSGNCMSFVNLFVGIARDQRLNPFYVEVRDLQRWNYKDGVIISQGHIVAGMYVDGELTTYDFLPYEAKAYRDFHPIDDITAMAHYYNNLGAEALLDGDQEEAGRYLRIAVALAPDFDKAINNLGIYYLREGRIDDVLAIYEEALERDPLNVALLTNQARAYQTLGDLDRAQELMGELDGVKQTSPYFFVYRGELALSQGDPQKALEYLQQALRRDNQIPEVHVALVKLYLALGDLPKARHHLERAIRLDATNQEALKYAALLDEGRDEGE